MICLRMLGEQGLFEKGHLRNAWPNRCYLVCIVEALNQHLTFSGWRLDYLWRSNKSLTMLKHHWVLLSQLNDHDWGRRSWMYALEWKELDWRYWIGAKSSMLSQIDDNWGKILPGFGKSSYYGKNPWDCGSTIKIGQIDIGLRESSY